MGARRELNCLKKPGGTETFGRTAAGCRSWKWERASDEALLDIRLCDLDLRIQGSWLEDSIRTLFRELEKKNLRFRPSFWLSNEWFTPDGVPGIAIPFYLAHPRLMALEARQMLEVEGGTKSSCLQILRHETGHALENAFELRDQPRLWNAFGNPRRPYPSFYSPRPFSRSYVRHLKGHYAQCHPDEDFAETFAVWLTPGSQWRQQYREWPALKKLEQVDSTMRSLAGRVPDNRSTTPLEPLSSLRRTLRQHYRYRRYHYGLSRPATHDRALQEIFAPTPRAQENVTAASFLRKIKKETVREVALRVDQYQYIVERVWEDCFQRSCALGLRVGAPRARARGAFTRYLTYQTLHYLNRGHHRIPI